MWRNFYKFLFFYHHFITTMLYIFQKQILANIHFDKTNIEISIWWTSFQITIITLKINFVHCTLIYCTSSPDFEWLLLFWLIRCHAWSTTSYAYLPLWLLIWIYALILYLTTILLYSKWIVLKAVLLFYALLRLQV